MARHTWTEYPNKGDKVVRLPDNGFEAKLPPGTVYTVVNCDVGSIKLEEIDGGWEPAYFAPAPIVETSKSESYEIY